MSNNKRIKNEIREIKERIDSICDCSLDSTDSCGDHAEYKSALEKRLFFLNWNSERGKVFMKDIS
ncbi:hypothetical protein RY43_23295 [Salmonella enterica]|uniref:hypothetical protein n=1 Tax=Salmonella enterica TaxID=28901 RepID=UPI00111BB2F6|nr:hypothetical protein [Salmonella enterica]HCZ1698908.1 hypothetical protein [Salmonella enterica subsp. enterica serovar Anatum str. 0262]HCZ1716510.1 hypothetical protein [Salmonella enterica subsp. enterica serovar Montevideo str. 0263]EAV8744251.1 hypothetical protein [Salmonella enterica]EAW4378475.1 hypothetical protein [Salmonella enterica]EAW8203227.1 hypothetical protein [Salmonella enterica]